MKIKNWWVVGEKSGRGRCIGTRLNPVVVDSLVAALMAGKKEPFKIVQIPIGFEIQTHGKMQMKK